MDTWFKGRESAFDNRDELKRPHKIVDGKVVPNVRKNGDKYTRQYWDKVAPCVHTRNDQLASQNTVHPEEDRVFSIRELMKIMTIPDEFKWTNFSLEELNALPEKIKSLVKERRNKDKTEYRRSSTNEHFISNSEKYKKIYGTRTFYNNSYK